MADSVLPRPFSCHTNSWRIPIIENKSDLYEIASDPSKKQDFNFRCWDVVDGSQDGVEAMERGGEIVCGDERWVLPSSVEERWWDSEQEFTSSEVLARYIAPGILR